MRIRYLILSVVLLNVGVLLPHNASAQIAINMVAVNGADAPATLPIKYYLPKELEPQDVLELGVFQIDYDVDKALYYVEAQADFKAKESRTFQIVVKDVWHITRSEVDLLKNQLTENLNLLDGNPNFDIAKIKKEKMDQEIEFIFSRQEEYSNRLDRRIEEYRAYAERLDEIRKQTFSLDYLEHEAEFGIVEEENNRTVKFMIQAQNPSDKEEKNVNHKYILPEEIRVEDVVDSKGFDVRFDEKKNKAYLSKKEKFKPGEKKSYEIVLKDIWYIEMAKVDSVQARTEKAMGELKESMYAASANYLYQKISQHLDRIRETQGKEQSIKKHIGTYRLNEKRYKEAAEELERLEQMLAIVRAKKLEEMEQSSVKNVLQRLKALRGLASLSDALFRKKISVTMTWKIIVGTLFFVGFFTGFHFFMWSKRAGVPGEERGLPAGETIAEVPRPGEGGGEDEEEEA